MMPICLDILSLSLVRSAEPSVHASLLVFGLVVCRLLSISIPLWYPVPGAWCPELCVVVNKQCLLMNCRDQALMNRKSLNFNLIERVKINLMR